MRADPARYPVGQFVLDDHAAAAGGRILVNTSFSPVVRVYSADGDSLRSLGSPHVYRRDGTKLHEGLPMAQPLLAGGSRLWTVAGEPPGPWILAAWSPRPGSVPR